MLERYTLTLHSEAIKKQIGVDPTPGYKPFYNAAPTHLLPVITGLHPEGFSFFYWGLPPEMTKNKPISRKLINADQDQLNSKITYNNALLRRRCLVPADGLYFWKKISRKGKVPYRFILNNEKAFMMAGIWEEFDSQNMDTHTFSIITVSASDNLKPFSDVMPAVIKEDNINLWLDSNTSLDKLSSILTNNPKEAMGSYPVSSMVNNPDFDKADLIEPTKAVDQFGNYSLFD